MNVLVTGVNGLVGSRLAPLLSARGHTVIGLGRGDRRAPGAFSYRAVDLTDEAGLTAAVDAIRPDVIVHLASLTDVDGCERAPAEAFRANSVAPGVLALAATRLGAHLVHVSTDYVFDGRSGPYYEDAVPNPQGKYALSKHMGEQAVRMLGASWAIARTAVVYGWPPAARPNFGSWVLGELRAGRRIRLFTDQVVSPSFADSVAEQLAELAERRLPGIWNVSGLEAVSRLRFGQAVCAEFGLDPGLLIPSLLADAGLASPRPARSGLLTDKVQGALAAKPLGLEEALSRFHRAVLAAETTPVTGGVRP